MRWTGGGWFESLGILLVDALHVVYAPFFSHSRVLHGFFQTLFKAHIEILTYKIGRPGCSRIVFISSDPNGAEPAPVIEYVPVHMRWSNI